jgi:ATP-dependent Clp protease ATP-binding subunit ClpA
MFERFTKQAREVVVGAQEEARGLGHDWIGTEHLLLAVLRRPQEPGAATLDRLGVTAENCRHAVYALAVSDTDTLGPEDAEALRTLGIDLDEIRRRTDAAFGKGALDRPADPGDDGRPRRGFLIGRIRRREGAGASAGHIPFTPRAKKALELSLREAIAVKDKHIGVEHVLLGLLRSDDRLTRELFERLGLEPGPVRDLVLADARKAA